MFDFDKETGEIWLYDAIGPSWAGLIDAESVIGAMRQMGGKDITIRVSSPGGSVWDAVDIYNAIERYPGKVTAQVDALAASAASFLILAADVVKAAKNATLMIHSAMSITFGNIKDHEKTIEMLGTADANIVGMYADKTGRSEKEIRSAMEAETWFTAAKALEFGLVDSVGDTSEIVARVPDGMFANVPDYLKVKSEAGTRTQYSGHLLRARTKAKLGV